MFGAVYAAEGSDGACLEAVVREFSPRIEHHGTAGRECTLDLSGLARLFGDARAIAQELRRTAADRHLQVRVAIAGTRVAARLLVRHRAGITVIEPGTEAAALAALPLALLDQLADGDDSAGPAPHAPAPPRTPTGQPAATLRRWGLRTLGELAALPPDDVAARLGQPGVEWQRLARGEDPRPLVPAVPEERFEQALDLEWPIEGLEPLSFVFGRLMEPLELHLARRDRGAAVLHVRLHLVTKAVHARSLQLPAPMRDARALRTLALLDLESHPPAAAIDRVVVAVDPTPGRVVQFSLLARPLPSPEQLSTLLARLGALMGEGRCGSPAPVDTWEPGAFAMTPFAPKDDAGGVGPEGRVGRVGRVGHVGQVGLAPRAAECSPFAPPAPPAPLALPAPLVPAAAAALRRFRVPVPARVTVEAGKPARVTVDRRGFSSGPVQTCAGPWRTSGAWWASEGGAVGETSGAGALHQPHALRDAPHSPQWDRDEWDVALRGGITYRLFRERDGERWFVEGVVD